MLLLNLNCFFLLFYLLQTCSDLGITDYVWQDKMTIATTYNGNLGSGLGFCPALRNGWLAYTKRPFLIWQVVATGHNRAIGQGALVIDDTDSELVGRGFCLGSNLNES